jgi:hypothetical protein
VRRNCVGVQFQRAVLAFLASMSRVGSPDDLDEQGERWRE